MKIIQVGIFFYQRKIEEKIQPGLVVKCICNMTLIVKTKTIENF